MSTGYTWRIKDFKLEQAPNDTNIVINGWLAGAGTGEPVLTSSGSVDYTLVQTAKSFLPGSDYYDFLIGVISTALATKYDSTFTATGTDGSNLLTGITSTASVLVGMALTGVGITSGTTVLSIPSSSSLQLSANQTRTYNGILSSPTIVLTGTLNGTSTVSGLSSTASLEVGMTANGVGLPSGAAILNIVDNNNIVLSGAATTSGSTTITFSTNPSAYQVTGVTPSNLSSLFVGLGVSGSQIANSTTVSAITSASSFTLSSAATAAASPGAFTFSGSASYSVSTSNWVIDYSEINTLLTQVNFGSL
jgi:hypothetical protein